MVHFPDVLRALSLVTGPLILTTPVVYSSQVHSRTVQALIDWNPLTYLVCSVRDLVLFGSLYGAWGYWICAGASGLLLLLAWRVFFVAELHVIERLA